MSTQLPEAALPPEAPPDTSTICCVIAHQHGTARHAPGTSVGGGISCRVGASPSSGWRSSSSFGIVARGSPAPAACIGCTVLRQESMERSLQVATCAVLHTSNGNYCLTSLQLVPSGCQLQVCAAAADGTLFCYLLYHSQVCRFQRAQQQQRAMLQAGRLTHSLTHIERCF
jgi:hypothetical protein